MRWVKSLGLALVLVAAIAGCLWMIFYLGIWLRTTYGVAHALNLTWSSLAAFLVVFWTVMFYKSDLFK